MNQLLGITAVDPIGEILGTGFYRFYSHVGVRGLAKENENNDTLYLLAVDATRPQTGQFRHFVRECKRVYKTIYVLDIWNPLLLAALQRYGFESTLLDLDGERTDAMQWPNSHP